MKSKVLFLCTGNSARSQMAKGLLRHIEGDRYEALSAGTNPSMLNPLAVQVMRELGIDIARQRSKSVQEFDGVPVQYVITVCSNAREQCPVFPAVVESSHWDLDDPASAQGDNEQRLAAFRRV